MALAEAIGVGQPAVAAWKKRGYIPAKKQQDILRAARLHGIPLSPSDFFDLDDTTPPAPAPLAEGDSPNGRDAP